MKLFNPICTLLLTGLLVLGVSQANAQTDNPCGAPMLRVDNCAGGNLLSFIGSSYQAGDAPVAASCTGTYTHDVWARFIAPGPGVNISFSTYAIPPTPPANPGQMTASIYQASPNCGNLSLAVGCQPVCSLGLGCILDVLHQSIGIAEVYTGLTPGQEYYVRIYWEALTASAPDSFIVSIVNGTACSPCPACYSTAQPLALSDMVLHAQERSHGIDLQWSDATHSTNNQTYTIEGSADRSGWTTLREGLFETISTAPATFRHLLLNGDQAGMQYFRVGKLDVNGTLQHSNVVSVRPKDDALHIDWTWHETGLLLTYTTAAPGQLRISDLRGKILYTETLDSGMNSLVVPAAYFTPGVYLLQLGDGQQAVTKKVALGY